MSTTPDLEELVAEYQELYRKGTAPSVGVFASAHPLHRADLLDLLPLVADLTDAAEHPAPTEAEGEGSVLGDYRLLRRLGSGGMSVVYEAEQLSLNRRVAVKLLSPALLRRAEHREQFAQESRLIARLHHPNIVQVLSAGEQDGRCYYAMELIEGVSLSGKHFRCAEDAVRCALQAARALDYAHRCGIVHADIKPGNLMQDAAGTVYVTDFGLAALCGERTTMGGTLRYMAPERLLNGEPTAAADQYALGVTLYEWLTGHPLYEEDTPQRLRKRLLQAPAPPLPLRGKRADLHAVINRTLQAEPQRRYPELSLLVADLERWLHGEPVSAETRPVSLRHNLHLWAKRKPALACAWAAAALAGVALVLSLAIGWARTDAALTAAKSNAAVAEEALDRIFSHVSAQTPTAQGSRLLHELLPYYRRLALSHTAGRQTEDTLNTVGICAMRSGDYATAAAAYGKWAEQSRRARPLRLKAQALQRSGKTEEAVAEYRRLLEHFSSSRRAEDRCECIRALQALGAAGDEEAHLRAFRLAKELVQSAPQKAEYLHLYATLAMSIPPALQQELLPELPLDTLLLRLTEEHPENPEYGLTLTEYATQRLSASRHFTRQDWESTDTAVSRAVQLAGRFPNTPSVVASAVRLLRAYSRAQSRRGNESAARRHTDRMLGMLELLFYSPETPDFVREVLLDMQLERCAARGASAQGRADVLRDVERELKLYNGPRASDFRRRWEEMQTGQEDGLPPSGE